MSEIKAIQTRYKGYHFRSRLEARWAVFFDTLGVRWEYEKEGYELRDGQRYLPDFWLPSLRTWVEVKGEMTSEPFSILQTFAEQTGLPVLMLVGAPWDVRVVAFYQDEDGYGYRPGYLLAMNSQMVLLNASIEFGNRPYRNKYPNEILMVNDEGSTPFEFRGCDPDDAKYITGHIYDSGVDLDESYAAFDSAIAASKRARFEFGETPR